MRPHGGAGAGTTTSRREPHPAGAAPGRRRRVLAPPARLLQNQAQIWPGCSVVPRTCRDVCGAVAEPRRGIRVSCGVWLLRGMPRRGRAAPSPTHRRHLRVRRATPSPQELEQELQGPQGPQAPGASCQWDQAGAGGLEICAGIPRPGLCLEKGDGGERLRGESAGAGIERPGVVAAHPSPLTCAVPTPLSQARSSSHQHLREQRP